MNVFFGAGITNYSFDNPPRTVSAVVSSRGFINYRSVNGSLFCLRKEGFYLTTHSTHFIYGYMASDIIMVKDHSDSERGNPLPPHGLVFPISSTGYFICTIPQTG